MIPDPLERTVRIPVQWIDGQWQLIGGGKMPELKPNICADLFMPAMYLANDEERARWTAGETVLFLKNGTDLFAQVNRNRVPGTLTDYALEKDHKMGHPSVFVQFQLLTDVSIYLTPGKKGGLVGGKCMISSLKLEVDSVNEALTRVSQAFEQDRKSFGGSVFLKVFVERDSKMIPLDDLRHQRENIAALDATRPRDRCESWLELSVSLSRVSEVWNANEQKKVAEGLVRRLAVMPLPKASDKLVEKVTAQYFDFRTKTLIRSESGLIELMNRFHDPNETSEEIQKLRGFHEAMDRTVLNAYGWQDLALSARCEFLPRPGERQPRFFRHSVHAENAMRLRWPDDFGQRVLDRLVSLTGDERDREDETQRWRS